MSKKECDHFWEIVLPFIGNTTKQKHKCIICGIVRDLEIPVLDLSIFNKEDTLKPGDVVTLLDGINFSISTDASLYVDKGSFGLVVGTGFTSDFVKVQLKVSTLVYLTTHVHKDKLKLEKNTRW